MPFQLPAISINADDEVVHLEAPEIYINEWVSDPGFAEMMQRETRDLGLLPSGVRYISSNRSHLVIEEAPRHRTINIRVEDDDVRDSSEDEDADHAVYLSAYEEAEVASRDGWGSYTLGFPWITYVVRIDPFAAKVEAIYCANASMPTYKAAHHSLCYLPLPNVYSSGKICYPPGSLRKEALGHRRTSELTVGELVNAAIDEFWSSAFNQEVSEFKDSHTWVHLHNCAVLIGSKGEGDGDLEQFGPGQKLIWKFWESLDLRAVVAGLPWVGVIHAGDMVAMLEAENANQIHHVNPTQGLLHALLPFHHLQQLRVYQPGLSHV